MVVEVVKRYSRQDVEGNRHKTFVFGDNLQRSGRGGQAAACRDQPNTFGIPTKYKPTMEESAFFSDSDPRACYEIYASISELLIRAMDGEHFVIPEDGVGSGYAELPERAPKMFGLIEGVLHMLTMIEPIERFNFDDS